MSQKQLNRYSVISRLIEGSITTLEAAESLGLSERQIKRLKKRSDGRRACVPNSQKYWP